MLENYYSWGQWILFCKEIDLITNTKYTEYKATLNVSSRDLCYWNTFVNFHIIWSLATLGLQNQNKVVRRPKGKHKSKLVLSKVDKNINSCLLA